MNEITGTTKMVTMTIGHFSWCIVAAMVMGACVGIGCYLLARNGLRDD